MPASAPDTSSTTFQLLHDALHVADLQYLPPSNNKGKTKGKGREIVEMTEEDWEVVTGAT
jgi:hypothetical protein